MDTRGSLRVLVLGVGGTVNQGIVKALRASATPVSIIGACISAEAAGLYLCDLAYVSPPASSPLFFDWLVDVCRREEPALLLTGVDAILSVIAPRAQELRDATGTIAVTSGANALMIAGDKFETARWLSANGFGAPASAAAEDECGWRDLARQHGFPLFAKPCRSRGSRGVLRIDDDADLHYVARKRGYVIQEYVGRDDEEYTAGCFSDRNGEVLGTIVMRRELEGGSTSRATVVEHDRIAAAARGIATALGAVGPCNMQFRLRDGEPVCFDINLRFSSTTPMRSRLGFRDVEAAVRMFAHGEDVRHLLQPQKGTALRYWNEIYVQPEALTALAHNGRLENPRRTVFIDGEDA